MSKNKAKKAIRFWEQQSDVLGGRRVAEIQKRILRKYQKHRNKNAKFGKES